MMSKNFSSLFALAALALVSSCTSQSPDTWPDGGNDAKPCARWWWMGSAVDSANLKGLIEQYAQSGLGGLEICPIYGVKGNDSIDIDFLSPRWMDMYSYARDEAKSHGMSLDMTCGTGWPFGGPNISLDQAAARLAFETLHIVSESDGTGVVWDTRIARERSRRGAKLINVYAFAADGRNVVLADKVSNDTLRWEAPAGDWTVYALWDARTMQAVKRAAPGGEGYVMNYFSRDVVKHYLSRFDSAFAKANQPFPNMMFSDSYEVYGADYTDGIFDDFERMHGYRPEAVLPLLLGKSVDNDSSRRIRADYAETIDSLLRSSFMETWTEWLHSHKSTAREQAHGSVGNILDLYALSEVPECETYGRAKVKIRDLVVPDTFARKNESDKSIMKFASSAAHTQGKKFTSAESLTWASEHFRMTPAICKPELDALFLAGINRIFYHGAAYSPAEAEWPGWKFYASVDYSPTNVFWSEMGELNQYVSRCLSFLQAGKPDADVLLYFPLYDIWYEHNDKCPSFSIEHLQVYADDFLRLVNELEFAGLQTDYISDRQILNTKSVGNLIETSNGVAYKTIIVPDVRFMHAKVLAKLEQLANAGATVIFCGRYPSDAPGLASASEQKAMDELVAALPAYKGSNVSYEFGAGHIVTADDAKLAAILNVDGITCESMTERDGLRYIRRRNDNGYTYFIANLDLKDIDATDVELAVKYADAVFYEPLTGKIGRAGRVGDNCLRVQLESGETVVLRTYDEVVDVPEWNYRSSASERQSLSVNSGWSIRFAQSEPAIDANKVFETDSLVWWTDLDDEVCKKNSGVAIYSSKFILPEGATNVVLRLANVKETVAIKVNGKEARGLWSFPYVLDITDLVANGDNSIELAVRGSAANRIAQMDRDGIVWRKFKDTNLLDVKGKVRDYAWWPIEPMGLKGPVVVEFDGVK